eukprot:6815139-Karenia_brevis.AAC.1
MEPLAKRWEEQGYGFKVEDGSNIHHLVWADNLFVIAASAEQGLDMMVELTKEFYSHGFSWKQGSLQAMFSKSLPGTNMEYEIETFGAFDVPAVTEMEVLGAMLDRSGSSEASMNHRLVKAESCSGALHRDLQKPAPWLEKLRAWSQGPVASCLHNVAGLHASPAVLVQLGQWERDKARKFLKLRRRPDESNFQYNHRTKHKTLETFWRNGLPLIHERVLRAQHRWTKEAMDFRWLAADGTAVYPLRELISMRQPRFWPFELAAGLELDPRNRTGWRHSRTGPVTNYERHLQTAY